MTEPSPRTRAEAVVGWRYWQVVGPGRLRSVTQRRIEWPPRTVLRAGCLGAGHRAPDERCDCGIYGARDLDSLRQHGLCLAPEALVVGRVALWGRVIDDVAGWRGELAEPVQLSVVLGLVPDDRLAQVVAALGAYGVPVDTVELADAVSGVSGAILANQAMSAAASWPPAPRPAATEEGAAPPPVSGPPPAPAPTATAARAPGKQ